MSIKNKFHVKLFFIILITIILNPINYAFSGLCNNKYYYINGVSVGADRDRGITANSIQSLLITRGIITSQLPRPKPAMPQGHSPLNIVTAFLI
jgi:hypothetical protein